MVLLNLSDVPYIDSSGIGELVSAFTSVRKAGGKLKLLNLTKRVRTVLEITRLYEVFDVQDNEIAAIHSFSAAAASA
jgi:anti-sigma B factor antagonist